MTEPLRFHLNEHVDPDLARALRRVEIDATTTTEANLHTSSDDAQLNFALSEGRILITHDQDFLRVGCPGPHA